MDENLRSELVQRIAHGLTTIGQKSDSSITEERVSAILEQCLQSINPSDAELLVNLSNTAISLFLKQGFVEEYRTTEKIILKKVL